GRADGAPQRRCQCQPSLVSATPQRRPVGSAPHGRPHRLSGPSRQARNPARLLTATAGALRNRPHVTDGSEVATYLTGPLRGIGSMLSALFLPLFSLGAKSWSPRLDLRRRRTLPPFMISSLGRRNTSRARRHYTLRPPSPCWSK